MAGLLDWYMAVIGHLLGGDSNVSPSESIGLIMVVTIVSVLNIKTDDLFPGSADFTLAGRSMCEVTLSGFGVGQGNFDRCNSSQ